ncbi:MAG TPA: acyl-CoA synthetase [Candidatus Saccharimonadales bacterium]|nr:acyl-CoA synthetase [Candidatus Saccharimonadales bacterium]
MARSGVPSRDYASVRAGFAWRIPARFNIGVATIGRHADRRPGATALIVEEESGAVRRYTFWELRRLATKLANVFTAHGLRPGDRVAILLPQGAETALAHLAAYRAGLVAVPLFVLFGPEALEYRLADSGAAAIVTDAANWPKVTEIRERLPDLRLAIVAGGEGVDGTLDFDRALSAASRRHRVRDTAADDPAIIIYTSGTTGPPKGVLHAHRFLLGHLPGVLLPQEFPPQPGDVFWTPADWAWIGGLYDVLFPAWFFGLPVVAHRARKFDPERAFDLMARHGIRNVFLPPTALKLMRQSGARPGAGVQLRSVGSGGETLGGELLEWGRGAFGVTINEFYGQTECNLIVSNSAGMMPVRAGSMGRPVPGHDVAVIDSDGQCVAAGVVGEIAVRRPDPVMFLGYWNRPEATRDKFVGDWLQTGDRGRADEDGYLWFQARADDVITSGGYRIGPGEIEGCLLGHPAVAMAAVVGVPDPIRTERVKAFVVLAAGRKPSAALTAELQDFVRTRLAAYEYPREVEYLDALPLTATGKVIRRELRARG